MLDISPTILAAAGGLTSLTSVSLAYYKYSKNSLSLEDLLDDEKEIEEKDTPSYTELPYAIQPERTEFVSGYEMKVHGKNDVYAGKQPREMMMKHRVNDDEYTWLGYNNTLKKGIEFLGLEKETLYTHASLFGESGSGKSTVLLNMMYQWAESGRGFAYIDPKGDDSNAVLQIIPEHRKDDVVYVNPSEEESNTLGFNILDTFQEPGTPEHKDEVDKTVDVLTTLLEEKSRDEWDDTTITVANVLLRELMLAEREYSLIDAYKILEGGEDKELFLERFGENMNDMEKSKFIDFDEASIRPLKSAIQIIATDNNISTLTSRTDTSISLGDVFEDGKILVCNIGSIDEGEQEFAAALIVQRLWAAADHRKDRLPEHERNLFHLILDELKAITKVRPDNPDLLTIGTILSQARSYRLSLTVSTQQPDQLDEDIMDEVLLNTKSKLLFNLGSGRAARGLSDEYDDVGAHKFGEIDKFKLLSKTRYKGKVSDSILIDTFPQFPPYRDDTQSLKDKMMEQYTDGEIVGIKSLDEYGLEPIEEDEEEEALEIHREGIVLNTDHVRAAILSAKEHSESSAASKSELTKTFKKNTSEIPFNEIKNKLIDPLIESGDVSTQEGDEKGYILTEEGKEEFKQEFSPLETQTAIAAIEKLSELGYYVTIPPVRNEQMLFDLRGSLPLDPLSDSDNIEEAEELKEQLKDHHSKLYNTFGDSDVGVRVTSSPKDEPDKIAATVVSSGSLEPIIALPEIDPTTNKMPSEHLSQLFEGEPFVRTENGVREFSMSEASGRVEVGENEYALTHSDCKWIDEDGDLVLINANTSEEITRFDEYNEASMNRTLLENTVGKEQFPVYAKEEDDEIAIMQEGTTLDTYDSLEALDKSPYSIVYRPFVPEAIIPENNEISKEDFSKLIFLSEDNEAEISTT